MRERRIVIDREGSRLFEIIAVGSWFGLFWAYELKAVVWTLLKIYAGKDVAF